MALYRELGIIGDLAYNYDILMQLLIDKGDLEKARNTLEQLDNEFQSKDEYFDKIKKNLKKKMKNSTPSNPPKNS